MKTTLMCVHCGGERKQGINDPVAFCNTPKCSGNPYGGTDDGQLDENETKLMDTIPDQQNFGERIVERAVEKGVGNIRERQQEDAGVIEVTMSAKFYMPTGGTARNQIAAFIRALADEGEIWLIRNEYTSYPLRKEANEHREDR